MEKGEEQKLKFKKKVTPSNWEAVWQVNMIKKKKQKNKERRAQRVIFHPSLLSERVKAKPEEDFCVQSVTV